MAVDPAAYEKFIEDYDKKVEIKGKLRLQGLWQYKIKTTEKK